MRPSSFGIGNSLLGLVGFAAVVAGCPAPQTFPDAGGDAPSGTDAPAIEGTTYTFVLDAITTPPTAAGGQAPGFNLDGQVTYLPGDACTSRQTDFVSPEGVMGVDNQFVGSVVGLVRQFVPTFSPQRALNGEMQRGRLLLGVRLRGVEDLANDERVAVDLMILRPSSCETDTCALTTSIAAVEAWRVYDDALATNLTGSIRRGRLEVHADALPLAFTVGELSIALTLYQASLAADVSAAGLQRGAFGGAVRIDETAALADSLRAGTGSLVVNALSDAADFSTGSECDALSLGAAFAGVTANIR